MSIPLLGFLTEVPLGIVRVQCALVEVPIGSGIHGQSEFSIFASPLLSSILITIMSFVGIRGTISIPPATAFFRLPLSFPFIPFASPPQT